MFMNRLRAGIVLAATLLVAPGCVSSEMREQISSLRECDGFGNIAEGGDGVTTRGSNWMVSAGSLTRRLQETKDGVSACDHALSIMEGNPSASWQREVSLLQSRSLHQLGRQDPEAALADLDRADTAVQTPPDVFYRRSLGLNTQLIRAYALVELDRQTEAEALVRDALNRRPYARKTPRASLLSLGEDADPELVESLLIASSRTSPNHAFSLLFWRFENQDYAGVVEMEGQIPDINPVLNGPAGQQSAISQRITTRFVQSASQLRNLGRLAYAYAALGQPDRARLTLARMDEVLAQFADTAPIDESTLSRREREEYVVERESNLNARSTFPKIRDFWTNIVDARLYLDNGDPESARAALSDLIAADLTSIPFRLRAELDGVSYETPDSLSGTELSRTMQGLPAHRPLDLFSHLFEGETAERVAQPTAFFDAILMSADRQSRGGCTETTSENGYDILCSAAQSGTLSNTEEMVLLRAAYRALSRNKPAFEILSREDKSLEGVGYVNGVPYTTGEISFESRIEVRFRDSAENCLRCLVADEVIANLRPVYESQDS